MGFPHDNMKVFKDWQKNTLKSIDQLKRQGKDIPNKQIKKIMVRGFRKIMSPDFIR